MLCIIFLFRSVFNFHNCYLRIMLKQFVAMGMLLCFMAQTFCNVAIELNYYFNTAAFEANCVNKEKPTLHCNGKCQLAKQIAQEEKKGEQSPGHKSENKTEVLSSKHFYPEVAIAPLFNRQQYIILNTGKPIYRAAGIFHPPCV